MKVTTAAQHDGLQLNILTLTVSTSTKSCSMSSRIGEEAMKWKTRREGETQGSSQIMMTFNKCVFCGQSECGDIHFSRFFWLRMS